MSRNQTSKIVDRATQHIVTVVLGDRWDSTPGVIPRKTVDKRRAKNRAARHSRQKNR
jgi:hypothetical protein